MTITPASNDSREATSQDDENDRRQAARQARRAVTSERIAMLLWRRKMTIADLGRAIGVERSTISLKLHTKRRWYLDELEDIAEVLATSVAFLYGDTDNDAPINPLIPASEETGISDSSGREARSPDLTIMSRAL